VVLSQSKLRESFANVQDVSMKRAFVYCVRSNEILALFDVPKC
jgi:hypothetical protein